MPDREKVIRAIGGCINIDDYCNVCDYDGCVFNHGSCEKDLLADALTLLEQEAVEPIFKQDTDGIFVWACGSCGAYMYHIYDGIDKAKEYAKYCRQCGRKVKWE